MVHSTGGEYSHNWALEEQSTLPSKFKNYKVEWQLVWSSRAIKQWSCYEGFLT